MHVPRFASEPARGAIRGKRVLVIDDEIGQASVLATLLRDEGLDATSTADPMGAVADYIPHSLDVIVVDLEMPRLSGVDAIIKLRRRQPDLPAILVSGFGPTDARIQRALALPNVEYLTKPVDVARLVACLSRLVGRRARSSLEPDFRALFEEAPGMFLVVAPDSGRTIIAASDAYLHATSTTRDAILGRGLFEAFPADADGVGTRDLAESIARAIASGVADPMPVRRADVRRLDGVSEERWWSSVNAPVLDRDGNARCVIHRVEDVTDLRPTERAGDARAGRIELEQHRADLRFRDLVDLAPDGVVASDRTGTILIVNVAAERMFGYSRVELVGKPIEVLLPERARALHPVHVARFVAAPHARSMGERLELVGRRKDGTEFPIEISLSPMNAERGLMVSAVIRDVTERKRIEEGARRANAYLGSAVESIQDAFALYDEHDRVMSHELRTPLNAILGFAELLQCDRKEPLSARQLDRLGHVVHGGAHLLRLIDDVLDLARIEAGRIDVSLEPVEVGPIVRDVVSALEPMASRHRIALTCSAELPAMVVADRTRVSQVLMNFGTNAIKYGRPEGHATFEVSRPASGVVRVSVTDDGIGIPKDKQTRIFEPFQRAGQEAGPIEGTGIGLAISRRLAGLMSGLVAFSSEVDRGSTFWIDLREYVATEEAPNRDPRETVASPLAGHGSRYVLVYVEDNPSNIAFMQAVVDELPRLELLTARTAEAGLELIRARRPAAVIMDINLPGMSGIEATQKLASWPETRSIPVIGLSAAAMPEDTLRARQAGFRRYLTKPAKLGELIPTLEEVLLGTAGH